MIMPIGPYLLCLFGVVALSYGEEICNKIELSGATHHPSANELYYYDPTIHCNGRPVWVDAARRHYMYYLLDGYDGWVVSADSCYKWGNFKIKAPTDEPTPYEVKDLDWSEYFPEQALWERSHTFRVTCVRGSSETANASPSRKTSTITPNKPKFLGMCGLVLCEEGLDCVESEDGNFKCICRTGLKSDGTCGVHTVAAFSGLSPIYAITLAGTVVLIAFLFVGLCIRCRSARSTTQKSVKLSVPGGSSTVKYRPLEEEITAHPA